MGGVPRGRRGSRSLQKKRGKRKGMQGLGVGEYLGYNNTQLKQKTGGASKKKSWAVWEETLTTTSYAVIARPTEKQ